MSGTHPHGGSISTLSRRLGPGDVLRRGALRPYRRIGVLDGEPHRWREDLLGAGAGRWLPADGATARPLLTVAHVTDLQLPDVGSTARFEFFNREFGDPLFAKLVPVQRPQEALTARAMHAMVSTLNRLNAEEGAPVSGRGLDLVVTTGDAIDNAQWNELRNWMALMSGGRVRPGSGGAGYQGVQGPSWPDDIFWCPDRPGGDLWQTQYGFGVRPGLLTAALADFDCPGLEVPWLACFGNHEALIQGVGVVTAELAAAMTGGVKPSRLVPGLDRRSALEVFTATGHEFFGEGSAPVAVSADTDRRPVGRREFVEAHFGAGERPDGHGFTARNRRDGTAYYSHDAGAVRIITLDTTSSAGGADGCLDATQARWLAAELAAVHSRHTAADGTVVETANEDRLVVLLSHHGPSTLTNTRGSLVDGTGEAAVTAAELVALLHRFPNVVLWLDGHTHVNAVRAHPGPAGPGSGFWEVTTCAVMDWPCQARVVELLDAGEGLLALACTMVDHEGRVVPAEGELHSTADLAGLHRELAGNVPWLGFDSPTSGTALDRNVVLGLRAPFDLGRLPASAP
ncbi:metallophosphoesterase (TIGR03767 family) [Kineococcus xinjiangensis]|uniref:Metallophosphoesterase (TIGR03767 family) n=1 Tax=Kineococcus xinjiangensis TaxID=512762 RepID=A0A2S6IWX9_9ACTN|nr:TIGR03767 family metallophosphoesterase [Kineococcus xinjiangensis]PPK98857.1 metallophosphoesterase (TIGR03767 family) [Kineococcus xinjiangensis]